MANLNKPDKEEKNSTVFTPLILSKYITELIEEHYNFKNIYDSCIGEGNLITFFKEKNKTIIGSDIKKQTKHQADIFFISDIKDYEYKADIKPDLIIINPPFNGNGKGKNNLLFPHLFLLRMFETFGYDIPLVMITGDNFLNNNLKNSKRLNFISNIEKRLTTIITLPLNIFDNVLFNSQVLFFNMPKLNPYYIFNEKKALLKFNFSEEEKAEIKKLIEENEELEKENIRLKNLIEEKKNKLKSDQ